MTVGSRWYCRSYVHGVVVAQAALILWGAWGCDRSKPSPPQGKAGEQLGNARKRQHPRPPKARLLKVSFYGFNGWPVRITANCQEQNLTVLGRYGPGSRVRWTDCRITRGELQQLNQLISDMASDLRGFRPRLDWFKGRRPPLD